jgi:Concanavalin A-like lectin/glucanases superfamily
MSVFIPNTAGVNLALTSYTPVITQPLTLMCWAYLSATTPANYRNAISAEPNLGMGCFSDGVTFDAGTITADHTGPVLAAGVWYHLCMSSSSASTTAHTINGYVNGAQVVANVADASTYTAYTGLTIGNYASGGNGDPFNGNIRDVRIWTRILTTQEVVSEMRSVVPVHRQGLLLWSPFDNDLYTDKSGRGFIWTATGTGQLLVSGNRKAWPGRGVVSSVR